MPVEIERKFLVRSDGWRERCDGGQRFCQGYLSRSGEATVRIRRAGPRAFITVKGTGGMARAEYEYEIPVEHPEAMLAELCRPPLIEKTRHEVEHAGLVWHVDEFAGDNEGLVLAEVELERPDQPVELPAWIGREVTDDPTYRNSNLARHPVGRRA